MKARRPFIRSVFILHSAFCILHLLPVDGLLRQWDHVMWSGAAKDGDGRPSLPELFRSRIVQPYVELQPIS
jgi:hypothetical protein